MTAGSSTANTWLGSALGPRYVEVPGVFGFKASNGGLRSLLISLPVPMAEGLNPRPTTTAPLRCITGGSTISGTLV
ncbi:hypothetical protein LA080_006182 [Diaporthe eres]|nr:hypothetical protein LA080_006182 [Diaporthe eres]